MGQLSKEPFAVMAMCEKTKENFGITVDPRRGHYTFCWSFKIKEGQEKRKGYDKKSVHGTVSFDSDFNSYPIVEATNSTSVADVERRCAITDRNL